MANLTGTFSSAFAGTLDCELHGTFYQGVARDAGFPSSSANMLLRGFVGPSGGPYFYTVGIDRFAPSITMRCPYPGGSVVWTIGTEVIAHQNAGIAVYGFKDLTMHLTLIKR